MRQGCAKTLLDALGERLPDGDLVGISVPLLYEADGATVVHSLRREPTVVRALGDTEQQLDERAAVRVHERRERRQGIEGAIRRRRRLRRGRFRLVARTAAKRKDDQRECAGLPV